MSVRVAINGFGRIGRLTFRNMLQRASEFEVVAINDLTDNKTLAHLLQFDSTHGRLGSEVTCDEQNIFVNGKAVRALSERNPSDLPWKQLEVDVVVESTGVFTRPPLLARKAGYDTHLAAGARRVVLSAPGQR